MEHAGLQFVRERYDWGTVSTIFERAISTAADARVSRRSLPAAATEPVLVPGGASGRRVPS
jgi:hypothetical protein